MGLCRNSMPGLRTLRGVLALSLIATGLVGCSGTITYGSSTPNPHGPSPGIAQVPSEPPLTPPPGTTPGTLLAFDARTGAPLWQSQAPMAEMGLPVISSGMVFVQGGYGGPRSVLAAFNARNGDLIWRAGSPAVCGVESIGPAILLVDSCQQAAAPPGIVKILRALDPKTRRELWTVEGGAAMAGSAAVLVIVVSAAGESKLRGLDPLTGQQLWEAKLTITNVPPLVNGQVALVQQYGCPTATNPPDVTARSCAGPGLARSFVSRIDPATGSQLWQAGFGPGSQLHRLLLGDVAAFSIDVELPPAPGQPPSEAPPPGAIGALDPATGAELWRQSVTTASSFPALAVPGTVYVEQFKPPSAQKQCPSARLDALESKSGTLRWRLDNLQACQLSVDSDGRAVVVVLTTFSGTKIVVLDAATGTELWDKPMVNSGLYELVHATVSGGVVYVAASGHYIAPSPVTGG